MRLRPFIRSRDFDLIRNWITDERAHAMWCANLIGYPLEEDNFDKVMAYAAEHFGDSPYVATEDDGKAVGFFCYSVNPATNEGMLKFVMVDPALRGRGIGQEMLRLAVRYAFEITGADAVQLNVFPENTRAVRCYEHAGFTERRTDPDAFVFGEETWGRRNMVIRKEPD